MKTYIVEFERPNLQHLQVHIAITLACQRLPYLPTHHGIAFHIYDTEQRLQGFFI